MQSYWAAISRRIGASSSPGRKVLRNSVNVSDEFTEDGVRDAVSFRVCEIMVDWMEEFQ